jgi:hypothetical protein
MIVLVRVIRSLFSETGVLYGEVRKCEADVRREADIAQRQGLSTSKCIAQV